MTRAPRQQRRAVAVPCNCCGRKTKNASGYCFQHFDMAPAEFKDGKPKRKVKHVR